MKKTFFLAMAAALVMTSCNNGGNTAEQKSDAPQSSDLKIAYVDIEELDSTYKFCTDFRIAQNLLKHSVVRKGKFINRFCSVN